MADNTEVPKIPEQPKKAPKKLTIFDANEQSEPAKAAPSKIHVKSDDNPSVPNVPDTKAGDTPAVLVDEEEMAAIAEAFANIPEVAQTPAATPIEMPVEPKKISVLHDDSQELPEPLQSASPAPEPEEAAETANEDSAEDVTADSSETETVPVPVEDTAEVTDEMPVTPPKKALDQLRNNVPSPPAPEPISEIAGETEKFADKETENVVDDIVATESDELLAREDAEAARAVKPPKKPNRLREILSNWWLNPATKWGAIVGLILLLGLIGLLPLSRYAILNAAGVRVQSSLNVISNESQQPLKNVQVNIGGQSAVTDDNGTVKFEKLKLGKTTLKIVKRGFSSVDQVRTLGWGSNPIGQVGLAATGTKFSFVAKDFLSGKAVLGAEATSGEYNAQADKDGKIALVIDKDNDKDLEVSIKATGYRDEKLTVKLTDLIEKTIKMAPAKKHVFVSKRSGKLDVFKIDADGKNEEKLLAATGTERDDLALLPHPTSDFVAMVSTREGKHNSAGYLLSSLFVINVKTGELTKIVQSERIQLIDWSADRVAFIAIAEGASAANPKRSRLYSFEIGQPGPKEIATANYFNDAVVFKGAIYYAPSSYAVPVTSVLFFKVNMDGTGQVTLLDKEVWNIFRSDFDTLLLSVQQDWYELKTLTPVKLGAAPASPTSHAFHDSQDKKHSLWIDNRDGKGVLLAYNTETKKDDIIATQSGLTLPSYWLNNTTVVYRINDGHEIADYVKNIEGGDAKKLKDVTPTDTANYFN